MNIDDGLRRYVTKNFELITGEDPFPTSRILSNSLENLMPGDGVGDKNIDGKSAAYFSTAAVDIWLRGVHSFLVSAALTDSSPVWASVVGYYSSHYAVRGLAHALGNFQLFRKSRLAILRLEKDRHICTFKKKPNKGGGEHRIYWHIVKDSPAFQEDQFFTRNDSNSDTSDVQHRNHASYADHLFIYPNFMPLEKQAIKERIDQISKIVLDTTPLPRLSQFPDLAFVQLVAYHRIVKFREFLDDILGEGNAFWNHCRTPAFAADYMDFQLVEGAGLAQPAAT